MQRLVAKAEPVKSQHAVVVQQDGLGLYIQRHRAGCLPAHAASLHQRLQRDQAVSHRALARHKAWQQAGAHQVLRWRNQGDLHAGQRALAQVPQVRQQMHVRRATAQQHPLLQQGCGG